MCTATNFIIILYNSIHETLFFIAKCNLFQVQSTVTFADLKDLSWDRITEPVCFPCHILEYAHFFLSESSERHWFTGFLREMGLVASIPPPGPPASNAHNLNQPFSLLNNGCIGPVDYLPEIIRVFSQSLKWDFTKCQVRFPLTAIEVSLNLLSGDPGMFGKYSACIAQSYSTSRQVHPLRTFAEASAGQSTSTENTTYRPYLIHL